MLAKRSHAPMLSKLLLAAAVIAVCPVARADESGPVKASGSPATGAPVTLSGQVVCSSCWLEADRTKIPYGTDEDVTCWTRCAKKGVPTALAVPETAGTRLYHLEFGAMKKPSRGWASYVGRQVQARGTVTAGEPATLRVDALEVREGAPHAAVPPSAAPDYALTDLSGTSQSLAALRGKIVVLNFWATWCGPCRKEIPALARVQNSFAPWGVQVVGASADESSERAAVETFVGKSKVNFPVWLGASTADMERFGLVPVLPATVIIDKSGRIAVRINGVTTEKELRTHIERILKSAPPEPAAAQARSDRPTSPPKVAATGSKRASVPS